MVRYHFFLLFFLLIFTLSIKGLLKLDLEERWGKQKNYFKLNQGGMWIQKEEEKSEKCEFQDYEYNATIPQEW